VAQLSAQSGNGDYVASRAEKLADLVVMNGESNDVLVAAACSALPTA